MARSRVRLAGVAEYRVSRPKSGTAGESRATKREGKGPPQGPTCTRATATRMPRVGGVSRGSAGPVCAHGSGLSGPAHKKQRGSAGSARRTPCSPAGHLLSCDTPLVSLLIAATAVSRFSRFCH